jgi:hypothetical protein
MTTVVLNGTFDLDVSHMDSFILSDEYAADTIASSVAMSAGGYKLGSGPVTQPDELGRPVAVPGKFYISAGVPEIIAKFHEVAPYVALNELFSLENQKMYGMSNFTVSFGKFGEDN